MDMARTSADSLWKVGIKRRWWRGVKGGDVMLFTASLALMGCVMERKQEAVGKGWEKWTMQVLNGEKEMGLNRTITEENMKERQNAEEVSEDSHSGGEDSNGNSTTGMESSNWEDVAGQSTASMP